MLRVDPEPFKSITAPREIEERGLNAVEGSTSGITSGGFALTFFADGSAIILYKGSTSKKDQALMAVNLNKNSLAILENVSGFILLGGKSSRYGSNKAFVEIDGVRLVDRVAGVMKSIFHRVILLTNTPEEYAYLQMPMVEDLVKGFGPMGGIYTGLTTLSDEAGFFVACDMPFLSESLIRHMVDVRDDFDAVVPRMDWMLEPLHALYSKKCLPVMHEAIGQHQHQILKCFAELRVRYVDEGELRLWDPELRSFFNINKPQDLPR